MRRTMRYLIPILVLILAFGAVTPALAHQPFFEEKDIQADAPWQIDDPTISTALYATLESDTDVDYFAFEGRAGQSILLEITIPLIEGQEDFGPTMALLGQDLPAYSTAPELPPQVVRPADGGVVLLPSPPEPTSIFHERFSGTSYWERQSERVTLPSDGRYVVAVWHDAGHAGRYVFVIGDKERLGGDPAFPVKMKKYWTPVSTFDRNDTLSPERATLIDLVLQFLRNTLKIR